MFFIVQVSKMSGHVVAALIVISVLDRLRRSAQSTCTSGAAGPAGINGLNGLNGLNGPAGPQGPSGGTFSYVQVNAATPSVSITADNTVIVASGNVSTSLTLTGLSVGNTITIFNGNDPSSGVYNVTVSAPGYSFNFSGNNSFQFANTGPVTQPFSVTLTVVSNNLIMYVLNI